MAIEFYATSRPINHLALTGVLTVLPCCSAAVLPWSRWGSQRGGRRRPCRQSRRTAQAAASPGTTPAPAGPCRSAAPACRTGTRRSTSRRAEGREELAVAGRADDEREALRAGEPQAVGVRRQVEGAVEADAVRRLAHADVLAVRAHERFAAAEVSGAQAAVDRHDDRGLRAVQQVRAVVPLGRVGRAPARNVAGQGTAAAAARVGQAP
jgi:hypothetical protein